MHGEHTLLGHQIVHDGEDGLFDLAGILAAGDEDQLLLIVDHDGGLGVGVVPLGHALKAGGGDDGEVGDIALQLLLGGPQQQLVDEQVLRGQLVDDAEGLGILGVGTGIAVEDEDLPVLQIGDHLFIQGVEDLLGGGHVHLAPGDVVVDALRVNNKLVVGGAAGVLSGGHAQRAGGAQLTLAAAQGLLHQLGGGEVAVNSAGIDDPERFQTISFHNSSSLI